MIAARSCRGVVVLGTATTEIECVLRRLGLAPLDDDSEKATLWLRAEETMSSRSKAEAGRPRRDEKRSAPALSRRLP